MKLPERAEGQGLVEFALILVLVAVIVIVILTVLGERVAVSYARIMGGMNGQTVTLRGEEAVVLYGATVSQSGPLCSVTIPAGTRVIPLDNGELVKNQGVTLSVNFGGSPVAARAITTNNNGIAQLAGALNASGPCGDLSYSW